MDNKRWGKTERPPPPHPTPWSLRGSLNRASHFCFEQLSCLTFGRSSTNGAKSRRRNTRKEGWRATLALCERFHLVSVGARLGLACLWFAEGRARECTPTKNHAPSAVLVRRQHQPLLLIAIVVIFLVIYVVICLLYLSRACSFNLLFFFFIFSFFICFSPLLFIKRRTPEILKGYRSWGMML